MGAEIWALTLAMAAGLLCALIMASLGMTLVARSFRPRASREAGIGQPAWRAARTARLARAALVGGVLAFTAAAIAETVSTSVHGPSAPAVKPSSVADAAFAARKQPRTRSSHSDRHVEAAQPTIKLQLADLGEQSAHAAAPQPTNCPTWADEIFGTHRIVPEMRSASICLRNAWCYAAVLPIPGLRLGEFSARGMDLVARVRCRWLGLVRRDGGLIFRHGRRGVVGVIRDGHVPGLFGGALLFLPVGHGLGEWRGMGRALFAAKVRSANR